MTVGEQLLVIFLMFLLSFVSLRGFILGVKRYLLNKSAYKKRKKGETLKEWFLYSRYREDLPKSLIIFYFCMLIVHLLGGCVCIAVCFLDFSSIIGDISAKVVLWFDFLCILLRMLFFWSPGRKYAYERWFKKKSAQNKGEQ